MTKTPSTLAYIVGVVVLQIAIAVALSHQPLWLILLASYTVGSVCNHALWVLIHDCTHNLAFKKTWANSLSQILANFPIIFPAAMSFRTYHLKHHIYQGEPDRDADLPRDFESKFIGNSVFGKSFWMLFFFAFQFLRVPFLKGIPMMNRWIALNWIVQFSFLAALIHFAGWGAFGYLAACTVFSVGLHPVGARWIQEHYVFSGNQETYSYYGPLNKIAFNVGYHNEHHDFMSIPWNHLPELRAMAPESYDTLYWHKSWTGLLLKFLLDPKMSLSSRVFRGESGLKRVKAEDDLNLGVSRVAAEPELVS